MEHLEFSIVLEHTAYSLASAGAAVVLSLGLGWLFAKLSYFVLRRHCKISSFAIILPIRAAVFGIAGTTYLSHLVMMMYVIHFGLTANWVFVASTVAMTSVGAWSVASFLTWKWLPDARDRSFLPFIHTVFVVAPWLCLRPGRIVAGGGLGSTEMGGIAQLDLGPIGWAVLAIALISLAIDLCFGIGRFWATQCAMHQRARKSEQSHATDG